MNLQIDMGIWNTKSFGNVTASDWLWQLETSEIINA